MPQIIDFARSFFTFRIDTLNKPPATASHPPPFSLNNARIQLECCCRITAHASAAPQTFLLGASCKTERVGVERDLWTEPNADFAPIFSDEHFMHIKTYAQAGMSVPRYPPESGSQPERQLARIEDAFDQFSTHVVRREAIALTTPAEIVRATLEQRPLVAVTELSDGDCRAQLEYPVKTMNANERDGIYQTDTGPVLFPDLARPPEEWLSGMELAFAAFNRENWVELLVRAPTEIETGARVYHYSKRVARTARNRLLTWRDA